MSQQSATSSTPAARPGLFYGYIIVAMAFGIEILTWGVYNAYGVFFNPLLGDLGWSRATISGAISASQILIGIGALSWGRLNDRFGPRVLMTASGLLTGLGYLLMSQINSVWQLYVFHGVIVGMGIGGTDIILLSTTTRWFVRKRGMMSGIVKIGTGVGIMLMPLLAAWLISAYGWRLAWAVIGGVIIVFVSAASQLLRRDPATMGLRPDGEELKIDLNIPVQESGLSLGEAARTRRFWMLCPAFLITLFGTMTVIVHFAPYVVYLGFSTSFSATMISVIGGASIAGRLVMGIFTDKHGGGRGMMLSFLLLALSFGWLQFARDAWALTLFALVYGFCHGGFYAIISPTVAELFGIRFHGSIFGVVVFSGSIGGFLGPLITGRIADTASYQTAFLLPLWLAVLGFILIAASGSAQRKTATSLG
ncbi:MAG TPA: MFS transporter [Dehalococcoidales bacterium]|nr:MFS transporter [Dehalococcoidales bacterium]